MSDRVHLNPWKESWAKAFHDEENTIIGALTANHHSAEVFHVGSSSVEGMISKPIIDILVCPADEIPLEEILPDLEGIGYKNLGECGRPGRYFLSRGDEPGDMFYLHLCHIDHPVGQDQLLFQQLERSVPEVFSGYYRLKTELCAIFSDNLTMYRELKGIYIEGVLSAYRAGKRNTLDWIIAEIEAERKKRLEEEDKKPRGEA